MNLKSFSELYAASVAGKRVALSIDEVKERAEEIISQTVAQIEARIKLTELKLDQALSRNAIDPTEVAIAKAEYEAALASAKYLASNARAELITKYNEIGGNATPAAVTKAIGLLISIHELDSNAVEKNSAVVVARKKFDEVLEETPEVAALKQEVKDLKDQLTQIKNAAATYLQGTAELGE